MTRSFPALFLILIASQRLMAAPQDAVISVSSEEVRIDVLATHKGKPVVDLKPNDFEILDNGVKQEIRYAVLQKDTPINAILVFDMSNSVAGMLLDRLRTAAAKFVSELKKEDHLTLITFNNAVKLEVAASRDFSPVQSALDKVKPAGNSSLFDGIYVGLTLSKSRPEPPLIIVFSDGRDTASFLTDQEAITTAEESEVTIYAVSPEAVAKKNPLRNIATITGGSLFEVNSSTNLGEVFVRILDQFRQRYLLTFTPAGVSGEGWHSLEVRLKNRPGEVSARQGYMK